MSLDYALVKNARIVSCEDRTIKDADILVNLKDGGVIERIESEIKLLPHMSAKVIKAAGHLVMPAFTDLVCRAGEPVFSYRDSLASTAQAAVHGGYGRILLFPELANDISESAVIRHIKTHTSREKCEILVSAPIIRRRSGREYPTSLNTLSSDGASAFIDGDGCSASPHTLREAMLTCQKKGYTFISRCREAELSVGALADGPVSMAMKLQGTPRSAETLALAKLIVLSADTGCPVHAAILSCKESFDMVREAKKRGVNITCSVSPMYFSFSENEVFFSGTKAKLDPPLRGDGDVRAVIEAISDGTVDAIATDHTPLSMAERETDFESAAFGSVGLETALSLSVTKLVGEGYIDIFRLVELLSVNPARILGRSASVREGEIADFVVVSLEKSVTVSPSYLKSKAKNTLCSGMTLRGAVTSSILGGKI